MQHNIIHKILIITAIALAISALIIMVSQSRSNYNQQKEKRYEKQLDNSFQSPQIREKSVS